MTYFISKINGFLVRIILHPTNVVILCERLNLVSVRPKQRTDVEVILRFHSFEPFDAGATQEVDEESLDLVVAMMSESHLIKIMRLLQLFEPGVTQLTSCHLDGERILLGVSLRIEMLYI